MMIIHIFFLFQPISSYTVNDQKYTKTIIKSREVQKEKTQRPTVMETLRCAVMNNKREYLQGLSQ